LETVKFSLKFAHEPEDEEDTTFTDVFDIGTDSIKSDFPG
jgi:hypothetical protein